MKGVLYRTDGGPPVDLAERAGDGTRRLAEMPPGSMEGADEVARYAGVLATEEPWAFPYWGKDDEGEGQVRWMSATLDLASASRVKSNADVTPAGLPLAWHHIVGWSWQGWDRVGAPAIGRVTDLEVKGKKLLGRVAVSALALRSAARTGLEGLDAGINRGLSIGFTPLALPKVKRKDGTRDKPDEMVYGTIALREVSLCPIPQLPGCGITGSRLTEGS